MFVFSLFCIRDNQLFTFCDEFSNSEEFNNLINFKKWFSEIKVLYWLDAISKWCIIMFLFLIFFCRRVCVAFNVMFILLTSSNIWIMSLWVLILMSCCWYMYLIKIMMSSASWVLIQAFNSVLILILIISWSKNNTFMFSSSVFSDRSDSLLTFCKL